MLILAALAALAGVWCLLAPPRAMLFGSRWQLRDGEQAEPSQAWITYTRASGVILLIGAVILTVWFFVADSRAQSRESLQKAWDIGYFPTLDELAIDLDPEVRQVPDVEAVLAGYTGVEQGIRPWKALVVGTDPVGDLGRKLDDGELVVAVRAGGCRPGPVLVHETASTVTVAVTGTGYEVGKGMITECGSRSTARLLSKPEAKSLLIVHVPLSTPLGGRELVLPDPPKRESKAQPIPGLHG